MRPTRPVALFAACVIAVLSLGPGVAAAAPPAHAAAGIAEPACGAEMPAAAPGSAGQAEDGAVACGATPVVPCLTSAGCHPDAGPALAAADGEWALPPTSRALAPAAGASDGVAPAIEDKPPRTLP